MYATCAAIMYDTLSVARPATLVIHDDGEALDVLTRLFEAAGFEVTTAITGFRAQVHLEGVRPVDVVVVPWDAAHPVGGEVYRWSLQRRYDLRDGFVFLAAETRRTSTGWSPGAASACRRRSRPRSSGSRPPRRPRRDPAARARGLRRDRDRLEHGRRQRRRHLPLDRTVKPWLAERVVFLADEEGDCAAVVAPGWPMFRKGADPRALTTVLREIVRQVRGEPAPF
jgi:hypothetical protein